MKKAAYLVLVSSLIVATLSVRVNVAAQCGHQKIEAVIVEPEFARDKYDVGDTQNWLGLYWVAKPTPHAEIRSCLVTLGTSPSEDATTGYPPVIVKPSKGIIFAFRGVPNVSRGCVTTKFYRRDLFTKEIGNMKFSMRGRRYEIAPKPNDESGRSGETWLVSGRRGQFLTVWTHNFVSDVTWIGDLDGDGKPDIYFHEEGMGGVRDGSLYLSSVGGKGNLVGSVAPADGIEIRHNYNR